jgi:hypothetical protein
MGASSDEAKSDAPLITVRSTGEEAEMPKRKNICKYKTISYTGALGSGKPLTGWTKNFQFAAGKARRGVTAKRSTKVIERCSHRGGMGAEHDVYLCTSHRGKVRCAKGTLRDKRWRHFEAVSRTTHGPARKK